MTDKPQWTVTMRVMRDISVTVEADDAAEARQKALNWEIEGDEQLGDTVDTKVTSIAKDS